MPGSKTPKTIGFLTGTRADFGKLKPLMRAVEAEPDLRCVVYATGMHMLSRYGFTVNEIHKAGLSSIYSFMNQFHGEPMELVLANTVSGLSRYFHEEQPDLLVVHGDRVETLAGAIVGSIRSMLVGHVEGGEVSGTIDELLRHSTTKLAHLHFVSNEQARRRLEQLGESPSSIHVVGSPNIDVMLSRDLPDVAEVKAHYGIDFDDFAIAAYHPVTTELDQQSRNAVQFVDALMESGISYVVIYPNNDEGSASIFSEYERIADHERFQLFPSLRFEYFLALLKHARFIAGNSSAGIHEAPVYGVPTVNVGTRQQGRSSGRSIIHCGEDKAAIARALADAASRGVAERSLAFGDGNSARRFVKALSDEGLWKTPRQKTFRDLASGSRETEK